MLKKLKNPFRESSRGTKGFTLIELLVVIAIIAILAVLIIINLNVARKKARDAVRKSDLSQIQSALEIFIDENKRYPDGTSKSPQGIFDPTDTRAPLHEILKEKLSDPLQKGGASEPNYYYSYEAIDGGVDYRLCAHQLEMTGEEYCIH